MIRQRHLACIFKHGCAAFQHASRRLPTIEEYDALVAKSSQQYKDLDLYINHAESLKMGIKKQKLENEELKNRSKSMKSATPNSRQTCLKFTMSLQMGMKIFKRLQPRFII